VGRNPGCPNASISRHQARPASCPTQTIACRASQPALTALLQARTARPTGGGQARPAAGRKASRECRGSGRRGDGLFKPYPLNILLFCSRYFLSSASQRCV